MDAANKTAAADGIADSADFNSRVFDLRMERSRADLFGMLERLYGERPDYAALLQGADQAHGRTRGRRGPTS